MSIAVVVTLSIETTGTNLSTTMPNEMVDASMTSSPASLWNYELQGSLSGTDNTVLISQNNVPSYLLLNPPTGLVGATLLLKGISTDAGINIGLDGPSLIPAGITNAIGATSVQTSVILNTNQTIQMPVGWF